MDRRDFLKMTTMAGLALAYPFGKREAHAQAAPYAGPYFVLMNAGGGWDPIYMCDPKLRPELNRLYAEIRQAGNIPFAPIPGDTAGLGYDVTYAATYDSYLRSPEAFFTKHAQRVLVLNGIDNSTNNHLTGSRVTWSGRVPEGYPAFGALCAAARAPDKPMAYLSSGGFDTTMNVIPLTRIRDVDSLRRVTFPNRIDPANPDGDKFHTDATFARIQAYQRDRLATQRGANRLPIVQRALGELHLARTGDLGLDRIQLPSALADLPGFQLNDLERMIQQAQIGFAAFKAGLAVSLNLSIGGFDSHANHDTNQPRQIAKILGAVDFVFEEATRQGLADKTVIVVGSDFGRGPAFNGTSTGSGKDHWPITSMLLMGPGIAGNRVVGSTNDEFRPIGVDPSSLAASATGITLKPEHIHRALRKLAGVSGTEVDRRFPLTGVDLPLFG